VRYKFVNNNRSLFTVKKMCQVLFISLSGFYRWTHKPFSTRQRENERLKNRIKELFDEHNGMVGSPMITADLHDEP